MPPLFLLSGPPGAGKSTVATALMQRFPRGVHLPMDDIRAFVVSGISHPSAGWTDETDRQVKLSRVIGSMAVDRYRDAGFAVAVADVLFPENVVDHCPQPAAHRVLLMPTLDETLARNLARKNKNFDTRDLTDLIQHVYAGILHQDWSGWLVLDTTDLTAEQTVGAILAATSGS